MSLARRHRARAAYFPATLAAALGAACTPQHADYFGTIAPQHGVDELWINNGAEPEWIDPGKCSDMPGAEVVMNLFAGLTEVNPQTLEPVPDVASSWERSPDGRDYTFHLRDTQWSDGTPLTAEDFVWSWKRVLDPATAARYGTMLHVLRGGRAFNERAVWVRPEGELSADRIERVLATHAKVRVVEREPWGEQRPAWPEFFAYYAGPEADKAAFSSWATELDNGLVDGVRCRVSIADSSVVGVEARDPHTLVAYLTGPAPYFLHLTGFHTLLPVPRHTLAKLAAEGANPDLWTRPENIVSNGAYILKSWRFKHDFTYERNARYWNKRTAQIPRIRALEVENTNTALNLYHSGELDWIGPNTPIPAEFMGHMARFHDMHQDANLSVYFYWLNTREPPLDNLKVRQALSLAIDRQALVDDITRAGQVPTAELVPDGLAGYQGLHRPIFDPGRARDLLREAGYPGGAGLPQLTLIYNTSEGHKQVAEAVQEMWRTHLGVNVALENQEWKVFLKNVEMRNFQIARLGWVGDYPDPNTFLHDLLTSHAGNNHSGWQNETFDNLLESANRSVDANARLSLLRQAEEIAMAAQPLIPFFIYTRSYVLKPYVRGFYGNFLDRHALKYLWIDKRFYHGVPVTDAPEHGS